LDQKQIEIISCYSLMLSRGEMEEEEQDKVKEVDAYWEQLEAANMETIFGPETDRDQQLLLSYAQ
jgi:hypothetical protein